MSKSKSLEATIREIFKYVDKTTYCKDDGRLYYRKNNKPVEKHHVAESDLEPGGSMSFVIDRAVKYAVSLEKSGKIRSLFLPRNMKKALGISHPRVFVDPKLKGVTFCIEKWLEDGYVQRIDFF